tara:strand:- start:236 stop:997 length:762 start_codon:yes stop_codon:yes gene_type:complete
MSANKYLYLMVKTHTITGLKYLCKKVTTSDSKAISYLGSGTRWNNHLKVHGKHINTEIIVKCELDKIEEFSKLCIEHSNKFNIVKSDEWANLIIETGKPGTKIDIYCGDKGTFFGKKHTEETKEKISIANRGDNNVMRRRPEILLKSIVTKNKPENKEKQRLIAIEVNSRPEVKEKIRQSKLGLNNPAADKNIYTLKNKFTGYIINGTRFSLIEQMKKLNSNNPSINILTNGDIGYFLRKDRIVKNVKGWTKI